MAERQRFADGVAGRAAPFPGARHVHDDEVIFTTSFHAANNVAPTAPSPSTATERPRQIHADSARSISTSTTVTRRNCARSSRCCAWTVMPPRSRNSTWRASWPLPSASCRARPTSGCSRHRTSASGSNSCSILKESRSTVPRSLETLQPHLHSATCGDLNLGKGSLVEQRSSLSNTDGPRFAELVPYLMNLEKTGESLGFTHSVSSEVDHVASRAPAAPKARQRRC